MQQLAAGVHVEHAGKLGVLHLFGTTHLLLARGDVVRRAVGVVSLECEREYLAEERRLDAGEDA